MARCGHAGWGSAEPQPYEYVPGAGDDEESWAHGLTPALLFQHAEVITCQSHLLLPVQGETGPQKTAGLPRFKAKACQGPPR